MYSTWVSAWRVPLMNVTAEISGQSPWRPTISSAPRPFCTVITAASGQWPAEPGAAVPAPSSSSRRSTGRRREIGRIGGGAHARGELVPPGHAQSVLGEGAGVLLPPAEDGHVADTGEVSGVEAADHPAADHADALDQRRSQQSRKASRPRRASSPAGTSQSEPGCAFPKAPLSEKISRS